MINILALGFFLSLDNFRTSVILGPLRFTWFRSVLIAAVFGFFDGLAPLLGILLGKYVGREIGPVAHLAGPVVLGLYGIFLIFQSLREKNSEDTDYLVCILGLPIPLSLDNIIAGAGLGLIGVSPVIPAVLFGAITALVTLAGLQIGKGISHLIRIRIRWELLTGVALIIESVVFGLGLLG